MYIAKNTAILGYMHLLAALLRQLRERGDMTDYQARFQQLLRELFQFDSADLDFGIYRIMNMKRAVVEPFIARDLPKSIADELALGALAEQAQAAKDLETARKKVLEALGEDALDTNGALAVQYHATPAGKTYLAAHERAKSAKGQEALEAAVYNHLYAFFSRYYQDGDFITKRRYSKKERYAIPYNGEEVHLYWANHDQYYIKTGEYFSDYGWKAPNGVSVHFRLSNADVEQNNVKGKKRFFVPLPDKIAWETGSHVLTIPFEFRPLTAQEAITYGGKNQQEAILARALEVIPKKLSGRDRADALTAVLAEKRQTEQGETVTHLAHHLRQYTRRNTSDFFIHKNLRGFLSRELDFYLKNEVLNLEEMEAAGEGLAEGWFQLMRLIKKVGCHIIEFLVQIEEFQKMLWEKRKFVTETFYCITVGVIPEDFYPKIADCEAQWEEWEELGLLKDEESKKKAKRPAFIQEHPSLPLDTRHFEPSFVDHLLASFNDLDELTDGLLVHSENWQALNLLGEKYRKGVKCIYIDPPYNTVSSAIPYKNDYKHSSFASMMYDRIKGLWSTLTRDGAIFVSIDKVERTIVQHVLDEIFGIDNRIEELIWAMNTNNSQAPNYSTNHEYVQVYAKDRPTTEQDRNMFREPKPGYEEVMELVSRLNIDYPSVEGIEEELRKLYEQHRMTLRDEVEARGLDWEEEQGNDPWKGLYNYSHAEYRDAAGRLVPEKAAKTMQARIWIWREADASMPATKQATSTRDPKHKNYRFYKPQHPVTGRPCPHPKSGWKFAFDDDEDSPERRSFISLDRDRRIVWGLDETKIPQLKRMLHEVETNVAKSVFSDFSDGEKQTSALFGQSGVFLAPKHADFISRFILHSAKNNGIIMDCFGGSGSTAHATIKLNRSDQGRRKFILVEMADYFDTVLLSRIKKVAFTPEWKDGKPKRMATAEEAERGPRLVKVIRLESYEDALNNIAFDTDGAQKALQLEDYLLKYMLKWETRHSETLLNVEKLSRPFAYQLHLHREGETRARPVDLPETLNYLIGLNVQTRKVYEDGGRRYLVYRGLTREGRRTAVLWRETEGWTEADYERDRDFMAEHKLAEGADEIYVNGDALIPGARALEGVFKARMFAGVEG
jgi:adenine-specific DNA-methyltransferase